MIGVFDSGIGGLSILRALRAELPDENFIYIADSGHAPYGERDYAHVLARSSALTAHLVGQGIKALVVACNTATAAAIDQLRVEHPGLPIIGVEPALKPAVALSRTRRIGIMATRTTLGSARFSVLLNALAGQAEFVLQPCDGLADAIERSVTAPAADATELIASCARHIRAMGQFGSNPREIDTLVLGCTHYPFASEVLRALVGPDVRLVETGVPVARQTRNRLLASGLLAKTCAGELSHGEKANPAGEKIALLTTGQGDQLLLAAERWLQLGSPVSLVQI